MFGIEKEAQMLGNMYRKGETPYSVPLLCATQFLFMTESHSEDDDVF
jgi:hypothetical protein